MPGYFSVIKWKNGLNAMYTVLQSICHIIISVALIHLAQYRHFSQRYCNGCNYPITFPVSGNRMGPSHKSHNASATYPTMHHSEQKGAHFCSEWCIVGYGTGVLWD